MTLTARFAEALTCAAGLHARQVRKASSVPYISHLLAVTSIALDYGADEDEAIAALLHDAIEDQGGASARELIRSQFGDRVLAIVEGCTDCDVTPKPPWRPRKEAYLASLSRADASVRLVAAADKLHNARSLLEDYRRLGEALWQHFQGGKQGTLWYYRAAVHALRSGGPDRLVDELDRTVSELESLVKVA